MINSNKLKGRIYEKGFNLTSISNELNISRPSMNSRMNGKIEFRASEIFKLCKLLDISSDDVNLYFFS